MDTQTHVWALEASVFQMGLNFPPLMRALRNEFEKNAFSYFENLDEIKVCDSNKIHTLPNAIIIHDSSLAAATARTIEVCDGITRHDLSSALGESALTPSREEPNLHGVTALRFLKASAQLQHVPTIIFNAFEDNVETFKKHGASHVLTSEQAFSVGKDQKPLRNLVQTYT